jgi:hypothetical protein
VWHLSATNASGKIPDSTASNRVGTIISAASAFPTNGVVGSGRGFDGSANGLITVGSVGISGTLPRTLSGWVKSSNGANSTWNNVFGLLPNSGSSAGKLFIMECTTNSQYALGLYGTDYTFLQMGTNWQYLAATYDGTYLDTFLNGTNVAVNAPGALVTVDNFLMSYRPDDSGGFRGSIDEVRIENVARSGNWIWACYMTMASNASFSVCGSVQASGKNIPPATWIQQYYLGMPATNYANLAGSIASNGMTVWQNYLAGTTPTNVNSCFSVTITNVAGQIVVSLPSVQTNSFDAGLTRYYEIDQCTNLLADGSWQPAPGYTSILANGGIIACTNATAPHTTFYRAKAKLQ